MAATATATADADAAPAGASPAPAPPAPPPVPDHCNYKNLLQEFAQQRYKKLPTYHHKYEGEQHQLQFECTVQVGSEQFSSAHSHRRLKEAEQDAAGVAYRILVNRKEGDVTDVLALIDQDMVLSKSILHEFSVKTKASQPSYSVSPKGLGLVNLFVASVLFAGDTYVGEAAINKKDAEQNAARVAIKSILARNDTCMSQIIRSKKNLITVITSLGHNKERGAVSQENTPTNNTLPFAAINFVPPVASAAYGTTNFVYPANVSSSTSMQSPCQVEVLNAAEPLQSGPSHTVPASQSISSAPIAVQRPNIIPAADPSFSSLAQAVPGSKKRKKNRFREQEAKEGRASSSISRIAK